MTRAYLRLPVVAALLMVYGCTSGSEAAEGDRLPWPPKSCASAPELCGAVADLITTARDGDSMAERLPSLQVRDDYYGEVEALAGLTPQSAVAEFDDRCTHDCVALLWWMDGGFPPAVESEDENSLEWTDQAHLVALGVTGTPLWIISGDVQLKARYDDEGMADLSSDPSLLAVPTAELLFTNGS